LSANIDKETSRVIVALDFADKKTTLGLVDRLDPALCRLKVGKELYTATGPQLVETLVSRGYDVFLDLKYHDIPNTVAAACRAAAALGVWMINVHASGGRAMMSAAREAIADHPHVKLIAVTLLTSMAQSDMDEIGLIGTPQEAVLRLARLADSAGLHGVVCSGLEASVLRADLGREFCLVTPGIRPVAVEDDQKRVLTPRAAIAQGAHYLVIGRPITQAPDPAAALRAINADIAKDVA
jgi:orotidine-5'-phosphate decarboxylase